MDAKKTQTVVLGVTGGIGAYKSCELVRVLSRRGYRVKVAMTESATRFVGPLTFRTLTGEPVAVTLWDDAPEDPVHHISLAKEADVFVVAPCTANMIAKIAHGRADDMLSTTILATEAPIVLAPAMNDRMWLDEATQDNVETLRARGVVFAGPGSGELACGDEGIGRMIDVETIADVVERECLRIRSLEGVKILVTAGGTREAIDPVRFIGNRSSGKTGFAIAEEAARRGADVTVVAGCVSVPDPYGCSVVRAESAALMHEAVIARAKGSDVVIMTAAVADYRPGAVADVKIKKDEATLTVELERTEDILAELGAMQGERIVVGFAAETGDPVAGGSKKLASKGADLVVANDVSRDGLGFDSDRNQVTIIDGAGTEELPEMDKTEIAGLLLDRVGSLLHEEEE